MPNISRIWAFLLMLFMPMVLFAQEVATEAVQTVTQVVDIPVVTNTEFLESLIQSLGGSKGASALVIAGIVAQVVLKFLGTPWGGSLMKKLGGTWKWVIASGVILVSGVTSLMVSGMDLTPALVHSTTLAAFSVFAHQLYKQVTEKKENKT